MWALEEEEGRRVKELELELGWVKEGQRNQRGLSEGTCAT